MSSPKKAPPHPSSAPAPSPPPLDVPTLLAQHKGDLITSLITIVARYNELVAQEASVRLEKEHLEKENQQLWRSLRSVGPGSAGGATRVVGTTKANGEGTGSKENLKGLGLAYERSNPSGNALRRGPSSENGIRGQRSDASLQSAPGPPVASASRSAASSNPLRKAVSLDLAREQTITTAPPTTRNTLLSANSENRLPSSTSMPMIQSARGMNGRTTPPSSDAQLLPHITPVSPLAIQHHMVNHDSDTGSPYSSRSPSIDPMQAAQRSLARADSPAPANITITEASPSLGSTATHGSVPFRDVGSPSSDHERSLHGSDHDEPLPSNASSRSDPTPSQSSKWTPSPNIPLPPSSFSPLPVTSPSNAAHPTLSAAFLPFTQVRVKSSSIDINEKGKENVSFLIEVSVTVPPSSDREHQGGTLRWSVEKKYSYILLLDSVVRAKNTKVEVRGVGALPDKALFKDHAPYKSDQRKIMLERYLQTLVSIPLRDQTTICNFFNSDVAPDSPPPTPTSGMSGWLTKRGRSFGGWQTRFYVLSNGTLSYYGTKGGSKLGEIPIQSAAIGRQSSRTAEVGDDTYLHAFLIRTTKKDEQDDHVLVAESDEARDAWVVALTSSPEKEAQKEKEATSSSAIGGDREVGSMARGIGEDGGTPSAARHDRSTSSPVPALDVAPVLKRRTTNESYLHPTPRIEPPPSKSIPLPLDRPTTPESRPDPPSNKIITSNVSGPSNAAALPAGYDFKKVERGKKTKSSFWNFSSRAAGPDKHVPPVMPAAPARPVFGVPLKEAVAISRIRTGLELPAVVYRTVEYLEAKNAESEEGIFRLSGSANVIRALRDRFNTEGDVNLLASPDYYDPHAVAGLLKAFLRELPVHILTRELHAEFFQVVDLQDRRERVNALGALVARLPIEEYTLFRFFFAHLCIIAQNSDENLMSTRNLSIVFSPTLAIPAQLFSLFLTEFDLIFAVEERTGKSKPIMVEPEPEPEPLIEATGIQKKARPNSQLYLLSGAAQLMENEDRGRLSEQIEEEEADAEGSQDVFVEFERSSSPLPSPTSLSLHPPRSPGLPTSPRHPTFVEI